MIAPRIGTLDWQPATEHPQLLAAPVAEAVQRASMPCFVASIDSALADTAAFCAAYEVPLDVSANCVVVQAQRGDLQTLAACLVLALDRADVNKAVRRQLNARRISFAAMDTAVSQTGMEYGGITPLGLPSHWPVLVDVSVAASAWLVIGSGIRGSKVAVSGADLQALPGAVVLALAQPRQPPGQPG